MSQTNLSKALLHGEKEIDIEALTQRIMRRDRRWIWSLGIACVIAWMAVVMLPWGTVMPMMAKVVRQEMDANEAMTQAARHEHLVLQAKILRQGTIMTFLLNVTAMFVAAICTVSLIILSRRATLRQVNARLADISEQLRKTLPRQ